MICTRYRAEPLAGLQRQPVRVPRIDRAARKLDRAHHACRPDLTVVGSSVAALSLMQTLALKRLWGCVCAIIGIGGNCERYEHRALGEFREAAGAAPPSPQGDVWTAAHSARLDARSCDRIH